MPTIVGLAVQRGAPIAEEARRLGKGAQTEVFELRNVGLPDLLRDIAREIEHRVPSALRWCKEVCVRRVGNQETLDELWTDFIILLANGWSECDADTVTFGAQSLHRGYRCFNHTCQRAAPACVCSSDHSSGVVGEKQWSTVSSRYADRQSRNTRNNGIGSRPVLWSPWLISDHNVRRVDLISREQAIRGHSEYRRHTRAVLGHVVRRIARADAAIERSINSLRHAAGAREKSVANALERGKGGGLGDCVRMTLGL